MNRAGCGDHIPNAINPYIHVPSGKEWTQGDGGDDAHDDDDDDEDDDDDGDWRSFFFSFSHSEDKSCPKSLGRWIATYYKECSKYNMAHKQETLHTRSWTQTNSKQSTAAETPKATNFTKHTGIKGT
jgi:hypothetical protein